MYLKVDTDSIIYKKFEEYTFKNKLIGFLPYFTDLLGFATR